MSTVQTHRRNKSMTSLSHCRTLVTVATFNEMENLPQLVDEVFAHAPKAEILVIDDNSPDGTGDWAARRAAHDERVHLLRRSGKLGLGTATMAGMQYAIRGDYEYVLNLDGDFSHHPRYIPALLASMENADVAIGSRYIPGGGVPDWPLKRKLMSRGVNALARGCLGLTARDCSGAFRCYRVAKLRELDFAAIQSRGYAFQEEILWHLKRVSARFVETPIVFTDRQYGRSKINSREALSALWIICRFGVKNWLGV